jgi:hypothetical protein
MYLRVHFPSELDFNLAADDCLSQKHFIFIGAACEAAVREIVERSSLMSSVSKRSAGGRNVGHGHLIA